MSGRPPTLKDECKLSNQVSVNLSKKDYDVLYEYCTANGSSMSETIRELIIKFLKSNEV